MRAINGAAQSLKEAYLSGHAHILLYSVAEFPRDETPATKQKVLRACAIYNAVEHRLERIVELLREAVEQIPDDARLRVDRQEAVDALDDLLRERNLWSCLVRYAMCWLTSYWPPKWYTVVRE